MTHIYCKPNLLLRLDERQELEAYRRAQRRIRRWSRSMIRPVDLEILLNLRDQWLKMKAERERALREAVLSRIARGSGGILKEVV